jgi:uncharacterized protein
MKESSLYIASGFFILTAAILSTGCGTRNQAPGNDPGAKENQSVGIPFRADATLSLFRGSESYQQMAIEIADSDSSRTRGLMQRDSLPEDSGMLFIFDREEPQSFWMANTPLSLDLIFINRDSSIVHIAKYAQPLSPDPVPSEEPARFVLEVEAGYADTKGILEGDRVTWSGNGD